MWRRDRKPRKGDRRAVALDASGLVSADPWRAVLSSDTVWALEQYDGRLWHLQGISDEAAAAARFTLGSRLPRR
jgi:hypothetical protein